jgi:hypothetical protein
MCIQSEKFRGIVRFMLSRLASIYSRYFKIENLDFISIRFIVEISMFKVFETC